jgi:phage-related protein
MPDKPLFWIGSSRKDLQALPAAVRQVFGYALRLAQQGKKHVAAKPLKGFHGASVLEVVEDHDGDTYRAVYTVQLEGRVFVLHVFQKKSKHGIAMPAADKEKIETRLKAAKDYEP